MPPAAFLLQMPSGCRRAFAAVLILMTWRELASSARPFFLLTAAPPPYFGRQILSTIDRLLACITPKTMNTTATAAAPPRLLYPNDGHHALPPPAPGRKVTTCLFRKSADARFHIFDDISRYRQVHFHDVVHSRRHPRAAWHQSGSIAAIMPRIFPHAPQCPSPKRRRAVDNIERRSK